MKKVIFSFLVLSLVISFCSCSGAFGHEKYTDIGQYPKIFNLTEIRHREALEIFPENLEQLNVQDFYFEWKLGIVGSADVQFLLSVTYDDLQLQEELSRIKSLANGKTVYDMETFEYDAYVLLLGYDCTSYYALIDGNTVHYVLLQLLDAKDIDIGTSLLPKGYEDLGNVKNVSYNVYK